LCVSENNISSSVGRAARGNARLGDGDTVVRSTSGNDDKIAWYENNMPLFCDRFESGDVSA
jgi:hypothetical protein